MATAVALLIGAMGVTPLNAVGVPQSELVLGQSDARDGQFALGEHFSGGSGSPVQIVVDEQEIDAGVAVLLENNEIDSVSVVSADSPSGTATITEDGIDSRPRTHHSDRARSYHAHSDAAVAFGVLLDTFVVRTLLVPALSYDLGRTKTPPSGFVVCG